MRKPNGVGECDDSTGIADGIGWGTECTGHGGGRGAGGLVMGEDEVGYGYDGAGCWPSCGGWRGDGSGEGGDPYGAGYLAWR